MATKEEKHELAKKRFERGLTYESTNRKDGLDDLRMLAGLDHWPKTIADERIADGRPVLTINKLPAFTDQVKNDSRLNKMAIKIIPYGNGATTDLAKMYQGIIRGIESLSDAQVSYQTAMDGSADNGFGYFRIVSEYSDDTTWDQDLKIKRIRNQFSVVIDPSSTEADTRDKNWAFVTEWVDRDDFKDEYGRDPLPWDSGKSDSNWFDEDRVRVAEYHVREPITKRLYLLSDGRTVDGDEWDKIVDELQAQEVLIHLEPNPQDPQGEPIPVEGPAPEGSGFPEQVLNPTPTVERTKEVKTYKVMQYLMDGEGIFDKSEWPGRFIPIIPVWGKEIVIEDKVYRRGVIRFAKDSQRMYDYFRTAATETVALAPKAPWVAEEEQIEDHEDDWNNANRKNIGVLKYKYKNNVPPPQRQVVTQTALGEITEANISDQEMKATTSMYAPSLGEPSNEVSGVAISGRKVESDIANYTYHDNLKRAIKFAGDILVEVIPHFYDTTRQVLTINDKEEEEVITINQEVKDDQTGEMVKINDVSVGRYRVKVVPGPSFTTQREEAAASMLDFIRVAPDTASLVVDLVAENMDWPGSAKIAARFRKILLPPGIDEEDFTPNQQPSLDEIIKQLKAQSMDLNNFKKKLDIIEKRRNLDGTYQEVAEAGAKGALQGAGVLPMEEREQ